LSSDASPRGERGPSRRIRLPVKRAGSRIGKQVLAAADHSMRSFVESVLAREPDLACDEVRALWRVHQGTSVSSAELDLINALYTVMRSASQPVTMAASTSDGTVGCFLLGLIAILVGGVALLPRHQPGGAVTTTGGFGTQVPFSCNLLASQPDAAQYLCRFSNATDREAGGLRLIFAGMAQFRLDHSVVDLYACLSGRPHKGLHGTRVPI
jgi:hypothetical protein